MAISRRTLLYRSAPLSLLPLWPSQCDPSDDRYVNQGTPFKHGVASGDPATDSVVIWTRVTGDEGAPAQVTVGWVMASDPGLTNVVGFGTFVTDPDIDHTVKVDVTGLRAGRTYYYRFQALGHPSAVGRTRTLPNRVRRLRIAYASCSNYPYGYFNAYGLIAQRADLDAVVHLGDYLYEYANAQFGDGTALDRVPDPNKEILTLEDYRKRHAQYKTDADLQEAHRQHPFIAVWDDHESADDSWSDGAANHQLDEGDWAVRKAAAIQAYWEWMPIRAVVEDDTGRIYRSFSFGDLCDLIMLDTRLVGRDQQAADPCDTATIDDPSRQLLGEAQEAWFFDELSASQARGAAWRLVGQQVMFGQLMLAPGECVLSPDQWDGYGASRARVLQALSDNAVDNVVILTGDIHSSWGMDISADPFNPASYDPVTGAGSVAVEFVTPGVTSPGIEEPLQAVLGATLVRQTHPHVKYVELNRRGYCLLDVTERRIQAEWYHVSTITERPATETLAAMLQVRNGDNHLSPAMEQTAAVADAPALAPAPVSSVPTA